MVADRAVQVNPVRSAAIRRALDAGTLSAESHVRDQLARIEALEPDVQAWTHLDADQALQQARAADERLRRGDRHPLLGLSVGLKDIIDTADMPTENGTVLHAGRRPQQDAVLVQQLRAAGAVILGKTVTTELATYAPGKTRNPHRLTHTPGGSSSGSAAAVACGMVDLAIGSQTNGSTIRPASFCGVASFKPTRMRIDRRGMLVQSPSFDTVGLFAADAQGLHTLLAALSAGTILRSESAADTPQERSTGLRLAWWCGPLESQLEPGIAEKLRQQARQWHARESLSPEPFDVESLIALHKQIMEAEIARSFRDEYERGAPRLSASLQGQIQRGRQTSEVEWQQALERLQALQSAVDTWMNDADVDALVMPSAPGGAPFGLDATGNPVFCTFATAMDLPALQLPVTQTDDDLPLGIQVVGRRGQDFKLLAWASGLI